jgi:hypothetical protein
MSRVGETIRQEQEQQVEQDEQEYEFIQIAKERNLFEQQAMLDARQYGLIVSRLKRPCR